MDKIEESSKEYADRHQKLNNFGIGKVYEYPRIYTSEKFAYEAGAREQKAIDDAELSKLKSAWEKEAQINHDDEANYQQGYHDAIEKALDWFSNYLDYLNMGICDENDWLRGSPESGKERFIKAMEE